MFYICITLSRLGTQEQSPPEYYKNLWEARGTWCHVPEDSVSPEWVRLPSLLPCHHVSISTWALGILLSPLQNYNNNWNWLSSYLKNRPTYSLQSQAKPMSCHMSAEGIAPLIFKLYILPKLPCLLSSRWHFKQGLSLKKM